MKTFHIIILMFVMGLTSVFAGNKKACKTVCYKNSEMSLLKKISHYPSDVLQRNEEGTVTISYKIIDHKFIIDNSASANETLRKYVIDSLNGKLVSDPNSEEKIVRFAFKLI